MRQSPCKVRKNLPSALFSPFPGLRQAMFRKATAAVFVCVHGCLAAVGKRKKKGKGNGKGGHTPPAGEKGGEVSSFYRELYFSKANKVFCGKSKGRAYNII